MAFHGRYASARGDAGKRGPGRAVQRGREGEGAALRANLRDASRRGVRLRALADARRSQRRGRGPGSLPARLQVARRLSRRERPGLAARHRTQHLLHVAPAQPARALECVVRRRDERGRRARRAGERGGSRGPGAAAAGRAAPRQCRARAASRRVPRGHRAARARGSFLQGDRSRRRHSHRHGDVAARARPQAPLATAATHPAGVMTMDCTEARSRLHPYLDRELDLEKALTVERHVAGCPSCRAELDRATALQGALRRHLHYHRAPAGLAERVRRQARGASTKVPRWPSIRQWLPMGAAVAATALLSWSAALQYAAVSGDERIAEQVVAGHARSIVTEHLIDVASSDRHTVKPWLSAKLDFSPNVVDLANAGFPLAGGRVDYMDNRPVAALVYRARQHVIDLF